METTCIDVLCVGALCCAAAVRERTEVAGHREQVRTLFEEWLRLLSTFPGALAVAAQQQGSPTTPAAAALGGVCIPVCMTVRVWVCMWLCVARQSCAQMACG